MSALIVVLALIALAGLVAVVVALEEWTGRAPRSQQRASAQRRLLLHAALAPQHEQPSPAAREGPVDLPHIERRTR